MNDVRRTRARTAVLCAWAALAAALLGWRWLGGAASISGLWTTLALLPLLLPLPQLLAGRDRVARWAPLTLLPALLLALTEAAAGGDARFMAALVLALLLAAVAAAIALLRVAGARG